MIKQMSGGMPAREQAASHLFLFSFEKHHSVNGQEWLREEHHEAAND